LISINQGQKLLVTTANCLLQQKCIIRYYYLYLCIGLYNLSAHSTIFIPYLTCQTSFLFFDKLFYFLKRKLYKHISKPFKIKHLPYTFQLNNINAEYSMLFSKRVIKNQVWIVFFFIHV